MKVVISKITLNELRIQSFITTGYLDEGIYLFQDSTWNDYGYSSHFKAFYYHEESTEIISFPIEIGLIKLCPDSEQMKILYDYIDSGVRLSEDLVLKEDDKICSCPLSLQYYFKLYETLNNDISKTINVLKLMGDITQLSDEQLSYYGKNNIFKYSILRNDRISSPYMTEFIKIIKAARNNIDTSKNTIEFILKFYEELYRSDLSIVKKTCNSINESQISNYFLAPFIARILEAIEEKEEIDDKDLYFYELKYSLSDYGESDEKDSLLLNVLQNICRIKKVLLFKWDTAEDTSLGHYTSMKTVPKLVGFGKDNYFRFTCASQLNDPLEGKVIFDFLNNAITTHSSGECSYISSSSNYSHFIASATSQNDSLPMWKQYTDDADGVYLTFSEDYLTRISRIDGMKFGKICYLNYSDRGVTKCIVDNEENDDVTTYLNNIFDAICKDPNLFNINNGLITRLTEISFLFKRYEYSYESEYRIFIEANVENLKSFDSTIDYMKKEHQTDLTVVTEADDNPVPRLRIAITACPIVYKSIKLGPKAINRDYVEPYVKACYKKNQELFNGGKEHIHYPDISVDESTIQYR